MIKKNIEITINSKTRQVNFEDNFLGINGENLQGYLIFKFEDNFVNGVPVLKVEQEDKTYNIYEVVKEDETYKVLIKSSLLKNDVIYMALSITENGTEEEIPVFITKKFYMYVGDTIESNEEIPDEYSAWIDVANSKLMDIDNSLEMANEKSEYAKGQGDYAKQQGDYAKQEATKVDGVVDYVIKTSDEALENSNTALSISKGANQALSFESYQALTTKFNNATKDAYRVGQSMYVKTLNVPDVWVAAITSTSKTYTYTNDTKFMNELTSTSGIRIGYYILYPLETEKVELSEYVRSSKDDNIVYCKYSGQDYGIEFSSSVAKAYTMVRRDSRGCVIGATPVLDNELTPKSYVDKKIKYAGIDAGSFGNGVLYITGINYENSLEYLYENVLSWVKSNLSGYETFWAISTKTNEVYTINDYSGFAELPVGLYFITIEYLTA